MITPAEAGRVTTVVTIVAAVVVWVAFWFCAFFEECLNVADQQRGDDLAEQNAMRAEQSHDEAEFV